MRKKIQIGVKTNSEFEKTQESIAKILFRKKKGVINLVLESSLRDYLRPFLSFKTLAHRNPKGFFATAPIPIHKSTPFLRRIHGACSIQVQLGHFLYRCSPPSFHRCEVEFCSCSEVPDLLLRPSSSPVKGLVCYRRSSMQGWAEGARDRHPVRRGRRREGRWGGFRGEVRVPGWGRSSFLLCSTGSLEWIFCYILCFFSDLVCLLFLAFFSLLVQTTNSWLLRRKCWIFFDMLGKEKFSLNLATLIHVSRIDTWYNPNFHHLCCCLQFRTTNYISGFNIQFIEHEPRCLLLFNLGFKGTFKNYDACRMGKEHMLLFQFSISFHVWIYSLFLLCMCWHSLWSQLGFYTLVECRSADCWIWLFIVCIATKRCFLGNL